MSYDYEFMSEYWSFIEILKNSGNKVFLYCYKSILEKDSNLDILDLMDNDEVLYCD